MNLRKYMALVTGGGITLVLLIIAVVMLVRFRNDYARVNAQLQERLQRLSALHNRDPYPSEENVVAARENLAQLQGFSKRLVEKLRSGQVEREQMEPAECHAFLERTVRDLTARAKEAGVELPEPFAFGFDRYYLKGDFPASQDIPRLVVQLKAVEKTCDMLSEAKVKEIISIKRTKFDQQSDARSTTQPPDRRRRRSSNTGMPQSTAPMPTDVEREDGLYEKERFEISFAVRESAIWDLLNRMARSDLFIVVTDIEIESAIGGSAAAIKKPGSAKPAGGGLVGWPQARPRREGEPPSHDDRVTAGREEVEVKLVFDVYRFIVGQEEEADR